MSYKAYLKQSGEGCDYTIGCGRTVIDIDANTVEEALHKLRCTVIEQYTGEQELESCELYEIREVIICDVQKWYDADKELVANEERCKLDKQERLEYERLKAKFEH